MTVQDVIVTLIAATAALSIVMRAIALSMPSHPSSSPCASCPTAHRLLRATARQHDERHYLDR
jgi:hypothetical protein